MSPTILHDGEWLGDIEIVRPIMVLRSSVLYAALQRKKKVFLKVAHPGAENRERLKRETEFLAAMQRRLQANERLPVLLAPYTNTSIRNNPFGRIVLRGHLLYFSIFAYVEGEPLRDILLKNPQLWIHHVGWIALGLASAVAFLHNKGLHHYSLSPDCVLVRFDKQQNAPRILLYDLGIACGAQELEQVWYAFCTPPAYTAPELLTGVHADYRTDVYGVGLTLYELLVGEPAFSFKLQSDAAVYRAVRRNQRLQINPREDVESVAQIALQAIAPQIEKRQLHTAVLAAQLRQQFGTPPKEQQSRWPDRPTMVIAIAALVLVGLLTALAITFSGT